MGDTIPWVPIMSPKLLTSHLRLLVATWLSAYVGCMAMHLPEKEPPPDPAQVPQPSGRLIFQPALVKSGGEESQQGTGFLARKLSGEIVGITSAHFLDFGGPALEEVIWLDVVTQKPVARFDRSFGRPGYLPQLEPMDLRSDYLIVFSDTEVIEQPVLELDLRLKPDVRERVWFPDKHDNAAEGYLLVEGTVTRSEEQYCAVRLDRQITPQSQSGSPFISQKTGKVIGTWSCARPGRDHFYVYLTPASQLAKVMREAKDRPLLRDVIGHADKQ